MTKIAPKHIFGYTTFSNCSEPEVQRAELRIGK